VEIGFLPVLKLADGEPGVTAGRCLKGLWQGADQMAALSDPTAAWLAQQITEVFPWTSAPAYLVRDNPRLNSSGAEQPLEYTFRRPRRWVQFPSAPWAVLPCSTRPIVPVPRKW
jgi:hypothetical protein